MRNETEQAIHERDCLIEAIIGINKKINIYNTNDLSGPELLLMCQDIGDYILYLEQALGEATNEH